MTQVLKNNRGRLPDKHEYLKAGCLYNLNDIIQFHNAHKAQEKGKKKENTSMLIDIRLQIAMYYNSG